MPLFGLIMFALAGIVDLSLLPQFAAWKPVIHGVFWFIAKVTAYIYAFMWFRFTFPRYRFDQLMKLGWHFLIPLSIVNVFCLAIALLLAKPAAEGGPGYSLGAMCILATVITLLIGGWLAWQSEKREEREREAFAAGD